MKTEKETRECYECFLALDSNGKPDLFKRMDTGIRGALAWILEDGDSFSARMAHQAIQHRIEEYRKFLRTN